MAKCLKEAKGIDSRWTECLKRHYPYHDAELGESLLVVLAYVLEGAPEILVQAKLTRSSTRKPATVKPQSEVQTEFKRHQGELASVVLVYKAWEKVPKRERPFWCKQNHVDSASVSRIQEVVMSLKQDVQTTERRRRSLRSASQSEMSDEGSLFDHLGIILLEVFPDCLYMRWLKGPHYYCCATVKPKIACTSDMTLFQLLNAELPRFVFCLPDARSRENLDPQSEIYVSLAVSNEVSYCGQSPVHENFDQLLLNAPVKVVLPYMGDAVLLRLVGNAGAIADLKTAINKACSQEDVLLTLEVQEPSATHLGWNMELYCPLMYEEQVLKLLIEKVRIIMEDMESEVETRYFPDSTDVKLLVSAGGQTQVVPRGQHPAMVHIIVVDRDLCEEEGCLDTIAFLNFVVRSSLEKCGKICNVEENENFPSETLWGTVWFQTRTSALQAYQMAKYFPMHPSLEIKVEIVDTEAPLYWLNCHWWKDQPVKNEMEVIFLSTEDLDRLRKKEQVYNNLRFEFDAKALKLTLTSQDPDPISWKGLFNDREKMVFPKQINYSHTVNCGATTEDIKQTEGELRQRIEKYFTDPEMFDLEINLPDPGASQTKGRIYSYCRSSLFHASDSMAFPAVNRVNNGKVCLSPGVYINFSAPKKVFEKVNPLLTAFLNSGKTQEQEEAQGEDPEQEEEGEGEDEEEEDDDDEGYDDFKEQVNDPMELMNNFSGEEMSMTAVLYKQYDLSQLKNFSRLLKPHVIRLRGEVLATLLATSGKDDQPNFVKVMKETDTFIKVVKKESILHVYGESDKVQAVKEKLKNLQVDLIEKAHVATQHKMPGKEDTETRPWRETLSFENDVCPLCPRDVKGVGFRLSLCGHRYCHPCFREKIDKVDTLEFPICCDVEYCRWQILFVDIEAICAYYNLPLTDVYLPAFQTLDAIMPCSTWDCEMMYHDCFQENQGLAQCFTCPLCKANMCMGCHEDPYHFGVTCTVNRALKTLDPETKAWLEQDRGSRKLCPKCLKGIEKVEGLPRVFCRRCEVFICWDCQDYGTYSRNKCHKCVREDAL